MRRVRAGRQAEARVPRMEGAAGLGGTGVWSWMLLVMWLPPAASSVRGSYTQRGHLGKVWEHSEVIEPRWLWPRTAGTGPEDKYPPYAEVLLTAGGRELVLSLQRNEQLITPNYTETYYSLADIPITRSPNMMEHCYYHGVVRGQTGSSVVASTCSGISGLITLNNNLSYIVEPMLEGNRKHLIYRAEHLELGRSNCAQQIFGEDLLVLSRAKKYPKRVRREDADGDRCVELYLVADYAEFQKHDLDLERTQRKMLEVTNYIDKFYRALKIRIALVGLEIWTSGDKCNVTENPYSTLRAFLAWRRKLLQHRPHDNAQLITGRSFHGTTIGLAPLQAMCSTYQSGGVNMDHSDNAIGVAATMAHEMGHNFGMSHDAAGCCSAKPEDGGCIMAAATGHPFPKVFNACNRRELDRFLRSGGGMCLSNTPDASTLYGGARCGNGFLEEGEECDCGDHEQCDNPCCNATTCTLLPGAECAHGSCCQRCKLKPPGFPCRKPSRPCDLPEFCTGRSPTCPPNSFQMDGTSCQGGRAFCYNGRCLTHQQQCRQLWGAGARIAPDVCFEKINSAGDQYGNCGRDMNGEYRRCEVSNAKCGKIQCLSPASKPLENNAVAIDTTITVEGKRVRCRGTHVYRAPEEEDMMDPGLVLSGTKCGENQICFEGLCRNTSFLQADECAKKCYGNGVCNNNQNCHCFAGWQPPYCKLPGNGGSIDSGPIPADGSLMLWVFIPGALLIGMALSLSIYFYQLRNKRRLSKSESSPAACPLRHSESQVKPCIVSTSGQRPHKQMLPKSPVPLHPNPKIEEKGHSQDYHKRKPTERGDPKTAHPVRIPPPSRPAPPPPAHTAPKISDPPKRAPPPIPPSRARQKAKQGDL